MPNSRLPATEDGEDAPRQLALGEVLCQRASGPSRGALSSSRSALRRLLVDLERLLVAEDDAVGLARELERREVVEHVLAHHLRVALERVAVARPRSARGTR